MHLRDKQVERFKLVFASPSVIGAHRHATTIQVALVADDMNLYGGFMAVKCRAYANVHHSPFVFRLTLHQYLGGIDTSLGKQLLTVVQFDVGSGETEFSALLETRHHLSGKGVAATKARACSLNVAIKELAPDGGTAHEDVSHGERRALQHFDAQFLPMSDVVVEALLAVVAELVVIAGNQTMRMELVAQHL